MRKNILMILGCLMISLGMCDRMDFGCERQSCQKAYSLNQTAVASWMNVPSALVKMIKDLYFLSETIEESRVILFFIYLCLIAVLYYAIRLYLLVKDTQIIRKMVLGTKSFVKTPITQPQEPNNNPNTNQPQSTQSPLITIPSTQKPSTDIPSNTPPTTPSSTYKSNHIQISNPLKHYYKHPTTKPQKVIIKIQDE